MVLQHLNKFSRVSSAVSSFIVGRNTINCKFTSHTYSKYWPRSRSTSHSKVEHTVSFLSHQFHSQTPICSTPSLTNVNKMIIKRGEETILEADYPPNKVNYEYKNICEALLEKAKENLKGGRSKWMTNSMTGETLTFSDVEEMSRKVASFFAKRGMNPGDKCIYLTSDVTRMFAIVIGVWRAGGVVCSSYAEDTTDTLADRVKDYNAKWMFCDVSGIPQCKTAAKTVAWPVEIFVFGSDAASLDGCTPVDDIFKDDGTKCPQQIVSGLDDPVLILCTSGTTGKSKGAVYTNRCVLNFCLGTDGIPRHNPRPALWLSKGTHVLGVLYPMRNVFVGDHSIMMNQVNKDNLLKAIDTYHPFLLFGFPLYLIAVVNDPAASKIDRSSIEIVCSGGIVLKDSFYETMGKLPNIRYVINGFGMTECGAITTTVDIGGSVEIIRAVPNIPPLSVGKLYPNTKLKVFDLETGKTVGPSKQGELCVSSPILCAGYWNRPQENKNNFKQDEDGATWMRTGDLGYFDENGFVFVVDRIKETFKYFNNHISPAELEEYLLLHPSVAEACVFGIKDIEGEGDTIPRAIVVLKKGATAKAEDISTFMNGKVAPYKQLRGGLEIVNELPRGKTGKVLRSMARELYGKQ